MTITPKSLAHVVYRTRRLAEMLDWYGTVFGAKVQHQNPAMSFLTFDDEHHRFAFLDLSVIDPEGAEPDAKTWTGVDHLAWTFARWTIYLKPTPIARPTASSLTGACITA